MTGGLVATLVFVQIGNQADVIPQIIIYSTSDILEQEPINHFIGKQHFSS